MDSIEKIIKEIKSDRNVQCCKFSSNFLNNVADVFEKYGFGTTKVFLQEKKGRYQFKDQATAILSVLKIFNKSMEIMQNRSIGRYIIKTLITIKSMEV